MSARPRVGIDLLYLDADAMRGVRRYAMELTAALARERLEAAAGFDLVAFVGRVPRDWTAALEEDGVRVVRLPLAGRGRLARLIAQQVLLPFACLLLSVRLLHSLNLPPPLLSPVRTHVTVHDLLHLDVAGSVKPSRRLLRDLMVRWCIWRGMTITTISNFSRDRICERYRLDKNRVAVVYHGIALHEPLAAAEEAPTIEGRYLLALGAGLPHKNIATLLEAFACSVASLEDDVRLVLPGLPNAEYGRLQVHARTLGISDRVAFPGYVSDDDLARLFRGATLFVNPSLYEGFGLTPLEAMAYGIPVVSSLEGALRELVEGAVQPIDDPRSAPSIAAAIDTALWDRRLRAALVTAGRERAQDFSWARAAQQLIKSYEAALTPPPVAASEEAQGTRG